MLSEPFDANALLQLSSCCKAYQTEFVQTHALSDVNLQILRGEYLAITGRSGSGKSTLLSIMGLMEPFDRGEMYFLGHNLSWLDERARARIRGRQIGFVFQFFHLIGDMTIFDNISLPMLYAGCASGSIKERVFSLAERLGIESRLRHFPAQLSGGQQQRAAIARALVNSPELLLVDEPTGNLDSESGAQVMRLLAELNAEGHTICLVSHDPLCLRDASRRLQMQDGKLLENP